MLVPFPAAADDHQTFNARIFTDVGAARILVEAKSTPEMLHETMSEILRNKETRQRMSAVAHGLAGAVAAQRVAEEIEASCKPI